MAYSYAGICASACSLIFASGQERLLGRFGTVAVHQTRTTYARTVTTYDVKYQIVDGQKKIISKIPVSSRQITKDVFKMSQQQEAILTKYLNEMGIDPSLLMIMKATTYQNLHPLTYTDLEKLHLATKSVEIESLVDPRICTYSTPADNCVHIPASPRAAPPPTASPSLDRG
jgi:hypothetical protein